LRGWRGIWVGWRVMIGVEVRSCVRVPVRSQPLPAQAGSVKYD
jgi:hypothetical protein